jgi:hypothetical protein
MELTREEIGIGKEIKVFTDNLENKERAIFAILYIEALNNMKKSLNEKDYNEKEILKYLCL